MNIYLSGTGGPKIEEKLLYKPDEIPLPGKTAVYSFQWVIFSLTVCAVIPGVVGTGLGLNPEEISNFIQRTFFFCGIFSVIQLYFGHRLPIFEGIGGMWYNILIIMGVIAPQIGKPLAELRGNIVLGMFIVGAIYIIIGFFGLIDKIMIVFTPAVKGTFFLLMGLQISGSIMRGMLGIWPHGGMVNLPGVILFIAVVGIIIWISLKQRGFLQSIGIFIGAMAGWAAAIFIGITEPPLFTSKGLALPEPLPWGMPQFDPGITVILLIVGFFTLSNLVTSIATFSELVGKEAENNDYNRATIITGLGNVFAGFFALIGFVPFASSIGFARVTGVASNRPFLIGSLIIMFLGLFPMIGSLFAAIPAQVGFAVILIMFCQLLGVAFMEYRKIYFDNRTGFIVGISILLGVGTMFIPPESMALMPLFVKSFVGNGLTVGLLICVLLEQVLIPRK
ncbi:MAG: purine/pyrimidine permease [Firmicutes bacterium]|nr:purine/pyrimidine permease [Bacillota bacterium]